MGAKARAEMEAARRSLEARKVEAHGPAALPCDNPKCNPFGKAALSKGTILIRLPNGGAVIKNVCSPLRCAWDLAGDLSATTSYAPHRKQVKE